MTYKTRGIIIKRTNLGETDRIVTILTDNHGLIRVVAKGVRKTLSKLAGHMEPFCVTDLLIAEGRNLDVVTGAVVKKCHLNLRNSLERTQTAYYLAEIVDRMLAERDPHEDIFELLDETLEHLNSEPPKLLTSYFELNFLAATGFHPELNKCVHCHKNLCLDKNRFDFSSGGVVCEDCGQGKVISNDAIKTLRLFLRHRLSTIKKINTNPELSREIIGICSYYLTFVNQKEFNSRSIVL